MKQKSVTIEEEHDDWVEEHHINLSSLVREAIEEKIVEFREPEGHGTSTEEQ